MRTCPYCGRHFKDARSLASHVWRQRSRGDASHAPEAPRPYDEFAEPAEKATAQPKSSAEKSSSPQVNNSDIAVKHSESTEKKELPPVGSSNTLQVNINEEVKPLPPLSLESTPEGAVGAGAETGSQAGTQAISNVADSFKNILKTVQDKYNESIAEVRESETDIDAIRRKLQWTDADTEHLANAAGPMIEKYLPALMSHLAEISFAVALISFALPKLIGLQELKAYRERQRKGGAGRAEKVETNTSGPRSAAPVEAFSDMQKSMEM